MLGHILGSHYYRKNHKINHRKNLSAERCQAAPIAAIEQAKIDIRKLTGPKSVKDSKKISLPSCLNPQINQRPSSSQSTISWMTNDTLLTKAILLLSQKCLPFSVFDSEEFKEFMAVAIDLGKRYQPPTSYALRNHIDVVYEETMNEVCKRIIANRGNLHICVDSYTFNTTKLVFNVLLLDGETEWFLGHAEADHLEKKEAKAIRKIFTIAIQMVEKMSGDSIEPVSSQPIVTGSSFWENIRSIPSTSTPLTPTRQLFSHSVSSITVDGAPVNKKAFKELSLKYPELIKLICTVHGLNLMMKHLTLKTAWTSHLNDQVGSVIKYFRNNTRPRNILFIGYAYQLKLPGATRFSSTFLSIQSFLAAADSFKKIAAAAFTDAGQRSEMQKE